MTARQALTPTEVGDSLTTYLADIANHELLTADDEVDLAQAIEAGREAEEKLAEGGVKGAEKVKLQRIASADASYQASVATVRQATDAKDAAQALVKRRHAESVSADAAATAQENKVAEMARWHAYMTAQSAKAETLLAAANDHLRRPKLAAAVMLMRFNPL